MEVGSRGEAPVGAWGSGIDLEDGTRLVPSLENKPGVRGFSPGKFLNLFLAVCAFLHILGLK